MFILVFMGKMQKMMCWLMAFWYGRQQGTKVQKNLSDSWLLLVGREIYSDGRDLELYFIATSSHGKNFTLVIGSSD